MYTTKPKITGTDGRMCVQFAPEKRGRKRELNEKQKKDCLEMEYLPLTHKPTKLYVMNEIGRGRKNTRSMVLAEIGVFLPSLIMARSASSRRVSRFENPTQSVKCVFPVFIYSLPSSGSSIKERMLYSSCKGPFLSAATNQYGVVITNKVSQWGIAENFTTRNLRKIAEDRH